MSLIDELILLYVCYVGICCILLYVCLLRFGDLESEECTSCFDRSPCVINILSQKKKIMKPSGKAEEDILTPQGPGRVLHSLTK